MSLLGICALTSMGLFLFSLAVLVYTDEKQSFKSFLKFKKKSKP